MESLSGSPFHETEGLDSRQPSLVGGKNAAHTGDAEDVEDDMASMKDLAPLPSLLGHGKGTMIINRAILLPFFATLNGRGKGSFLRGPKNSLYSEQPTTGTRRDFLTC